MTENPIPNAPQQSPAAAAAPETDASAIERRLERIAAQMAEALSHPDLVRGNVMASGCELMDLASKLKNAIDVELANSPHYLGQFEEVSPALDLLLRMTKQISQYAQLDVRLAAAHRAADPVRANPPRSTRAKPTPPPLSEFFGL